MLAQAVDELARADYLGGEGGAVQDVTRPEELWRHSHRRQTQADVAAGVEGGVEVVLVVKDILAHGVVDEGQDDGEAAEPQQHQQRRLVLLQHCLHPDTKMARSASQASPQDMCEGVCVCMCVLLDWVSGWIGSK